ncbi:integrase core domain-containing protein [Streptomyces mirabilis]|uniref:integrase core domain-containing protein n=1 Tax=Streptomyces mirabilis TaxID=68239 RepID=UPI003649654C
MDLEDAGTEVVLSGVRMPRMNSITERWVQTCPRKLLDPTLIWNQRHLLHALRQFGRSYNGHRPHQGITNAAPLRPLPAPLADPEKITRLDVRRHERLGGHPGRVPIRGVTSVGGVYGKRRPERRRAADGDGCSRRLRHEAFGDGQGGRHDAQLRIHLRTTGQHGAV